VEVHDRRAVLRRMRLGDRPRVDALTFEQLRLEHQCPERLAQQLFFELQMREVELASLKSELAVSEALRLLDQALRARAEQKLATATAPRRINRDREED
jgi:hypothetical protein